jgi:hypothetical protein
MMGQQLGRPGRRKVNNIKMDLKDTEYGNDLNSSGLG